MRWKVVHADCEEVATVRDVPMNGCGVESSVEMEIGIASKFPLFLAHSCYSYGFPHNASNRWARPQLYL